MNKIKNYMLSTALLVYCFTAVYAQETLVLDAGEQVQVVDSIAKFMNERYVFADKGKEMADLVTQKLRSGSYNGIKEPRAFARKLTEDLLTINNDRHIGVMYMPERIAMMLAAAEDENNTELEELETRLNQYNNFDFEEIKILPGNVGYLKLNSFQGASISGPTAVAAMNFLANTDALIIDLRDNGGGSPSLIQLMTTYFFDDTQHLNSFYYREDEETQQFWTLTHVPGKKLLHTNIYVLTSSRTFSGAEEFTYNLKNLERAVIVGETTGGGAHPVASYIINDHFIVRVPFGRAVNPITRTNWEGSGVEPHIQAERSKAFDVAYMMALDSLMGTEENENIRGALQWAYEGLHAMLNPVEISDKILKKYSGKYGPRDIIFENGMLYYQREGRQKMQMIPMDENLFGFKELDYFRLKVIMQNGKAIAVEGHYEGGRTDRNDRTD